MYRSSWEPSKVLRQEPMRGAAAPRLLLRRRWQHRWRPGRSCNAAPAAAWTRAGCTRAPTDKRSPACWYSAASSLLQYAQAAPVWAPRLSARWPCCARARHARTYLPGPQAHGIRVLGALRVPRRCACATLVVELASCFQRLYRGKGSGEVLVPLHIYYDRAPTRAPPCDVVQN